MTYEFIYGLFSSAMSENLAKILSHLVVLILIAAICFVLIVTARIIIAKVVTVIVDRTRFKWDNAMLKNKLFHSIAWLAVPVTMNLFAPSFAGVSLYSKAVAIVFAVVFAAIINALINSLDEIYRSHPVSSARPLRSFFQVLKVVLIIIVSIIEIAILMDESPWVLITGLGATTAITSLIFKDAILGFVAGIQLTSNDMIRIGDWIEMPGSNADGTVIDLTIMTVKVRNFDNTITSIPAYTLISQAFINWRGMSMSGGRRIKRAIYIDSATVKLCDMEMLERFRNIALIAHYIDEKVAELTKYNRSISADTSDPVNGRRLTNIGTFRAYVTAYLKENPNINHDMIVMVRQIAPDDRGIALEVYAFTDTTEWVKYENIQSDIFDHLYAVAREFELEIYQKPSGSDIRSLKEKN